MATTAKPARGVFAWTRVSRPSDRYILWVVLVLLSLGVVAVYSSGTFLAEKIAGGNTEQVLGRHLLRIFFSIGAIIFFSRIDYHLLARIGRWLLIASMVALVAVQIWGVTAGGASRWLRIGFINWQPSEIARVALVVHVAYLLARKQEYIGSFKRAFVPVMVWTLPAVILIGMSDLSTSVLVFGTVVIMCFVGRIRMLHLGASLIIPLVLGLAFIASSPERASRIESFAHTNFFSGSADSEATSPQEGGYQARQARIAMAEGGLIGVGPGKSIRRDFLPAPYNDFIFAIIAEEYGIIGASLLLVLFCIILFRGYLRVARYAEDPLGLLLAVGITSMIALYAFVNAGVAAGLLPVTGLPLPFVSYGGTSLVANGVLIGILLNVSRHTT